MKLAIRGGEPIRTKPFPTWPQWGREEAEGLQRVLQSGKWGSLHGEEVHLFEKEFADYQGSEFAIAVSSGTTALQVALAATGLQAFDEVILPAYTFIATATAVLVNGAVPVFADIDPETYNISPQSIEAAITGRTRAIMPVHFAGRPADMDQIKDIAQKHSLTIIEDAAQGWGAQWRGRGVGTLGEMGCFSFQSSKNITSGEGGMILTNDEEFSKLAESYTNCGRVEGGIWYAHYYLGSNYRMTEFQAAILRAQLSRYPADLALRQKSMAYLDRQLSELPGVSPLKADQRMTSHACHIYIFRYQPEAFDQLEKSQFIQALKAEGIPCSGGYSIPLYEQPVLKNQSFGPFSKILKERAHYTGLKLPHTERACASEAIWLQQSVLLAGPEGMADVVRAIEKIYENRHELL